MPRFRDAFAPLRDTMRELIAVTQGPEEAREQFRGLGNELETIFDIILKRSPENLDLTLVESMDRLCNHLRSEVLVLREIQSSSDFRLAVDAAQLDTTLSMHGDQINSTLDARLDRLCPSWSAFYDSERIGTLKRGPCAQDTCEGVLARIISWTPSRHSGPLFWLTGMAGTGKTTIAYSLCHGLQNLQRLAGSFFCSRLLPGCKDANQIIPSLAYQLAHYVPRLRFVISQALMENSNIHGLPLRKQFELLIARPVIGNRGSIPDGATFVIDALDECDDKDGISRIVDALQTRGKDLGIKFVICSRPEPEVRDQMGSYAGQGWASRLVLHELEASVVQGDVKKYLQKALEPIEPSESDITTLVQRAGILFAYAAAVVQYIGYQNFSRNPRRRLANVLNGSAVSSDNLYKEIDERYSLILEAAIEDPGLDDEDKDDTKRVLHAVVSAREPVTISTLSRLTGIDEVERVRAALRPLWSVLHIHESSGLISTLHASFNDYMCDPARSKSYYCDLTTQNYVLVQRCFDCIQTTMPQFNICGLNSSYILDDMVENIAERIGKAISSELSYACRYWAKHLVCIKVTSDIIERLEDFLSMRFLLWMEVLNLEKCLIIGIKSLRQVEDWCIRHSFSEELIHLVHDAWRFAVAFTASPASQSTPHIYVSMLPFWPESNPIAQHYATRVRGIALTGTALKRQSHLLATWDIGNPATSVICSPDSTQVAMILEGQIYVREFFTGKLLHGPLTQSGHPIQSISFSSNGTYIVSASPDGLIWWWDVISGQANPKLNGQPGSVHSIITSSNGIHVVSRIDDKVLRICHALSGRSVLLRHSQSITAVAHSPNNSHIASGTGGGAIYLWDSQRGVALGSFEGHVGSVVSISLSIGGDRIVSGSDNNNIYVWDSSGRQTVPSPLEGHSGPITSVALSSSGTRIVSGSKDTTICLWDAESGDMLLGPLVGHTNSISSVSFSPDGACVMSNSDDGTIRIWDACIKRGTLDSLAGHKGSVTSVAFYRASAGVRIASGSDDGAIRVWDMESGKSVLGPLVGHSGSVTSVTLSPDGAYMASGSDDNTICVWNAESGQVVLGPLEGHVDSITSVAFSPDSAVVISGSLDKTIRIWDSKSGQPVSEPLVGHDGPVTSIVLSPDGSHILSGSVDKTLRLWNAQSGQQLLRPFEAHDGPVTSVAFSPDGTLVASASGDKAIRMWQPWAGKDTLAVLEENGGWVSSVAFSSDGDRVISGSWDMAVCVWDLKSKQKLLGPLQGHKGPVTSVAVSLDDVRIISGSSDRTICVWDAQDGSIVLGPLEGHTAIVTSVALSADGSRIVSGSGDKTVRVWDGRNGRMIKPLTGHEDWVNCVVFSPDGSQIVSGSSDKTIRIWDPVDGQLLFGPLTGHTEPVMSVTFSPNGRHVASGSCDRLIRIWDAQVGKLVLHPLKGHQGWVTSVAISPDGAYLASGSSDKSIRVWSMHNGKLLLKFTGHTNWASSVAFSPDGAYSCPQNLSDTPHFQAFDSKRVVRRAQNCR